MEKIKANIVEKILNAMDNPHTSISHVLILGCAIAAHWFPTHKDALLGTIAVLSGYGLAGSRSVESQEDNNMAKLQELPKTNVK